MEFIFAIYAKYAPGKYFLYFAVKSFLYNVIKANFNTRMKGVNCLKASKRWRNIGGIGDNWRKTWIWKFLKAKYRLKLWSMRVKVNELKMKYFLNMAGIIGVKQDMSEKGCKTKIRMVCRNYMNLKMVWTYENFLMKGVMRIAPDVKARKVRPRSGWMESVNRLLGKQTKN